MAPRNIFHITVLRVSLDHSRDILHPDIEKTEHHILPELLDLRESNCLERATLREKYAMPANANIRFTCWQVKTGDASLFNVGRLDFDQILIVLGEELSYYMYYLRHPNELTNVSGYTATPLTYCGCCLNIHYKNVIEKLTIHASGNIKEKPKRV